MTKKKNNPVDEQDHTSRKHSLLSPSSAHRWLNCPPSARLGEQFVNEGSEYALEGTQAHELCEYKLRQMTTEGQSDRDIREDLSFYNEEMEVMTDRYQQFVARLLLESLINGEKPKMYIEKKIDYSEFVPEGSGIADCIIISDDTLHVIDFKYGLGVAVDSHQNPQLMLYALGALLAYEECDLIRHIKMTIFQPRRNNVQSTEMSTKELLDWAESIKPIAASAFNGDGEFKSGGWCKFCPARETCRKRAEDNLKLVAEDFKDPELLGDEDIERILPLCDNLISWAEDIKQIALDKAQDGKKWDGFKLVEGRALRRFTNENEVVKTAKTLGIDPYVSKLRSVADIQKQVGKEKFNEIFGSLVEKPQGKPTLVPEDDPRISLDKAKELNDAQKILSEIFGTNI